jgi:phosphate transport system protein
MTGPQTTGERQSGFRHFHEQLAELKQRLLDMSDKAESLIDLAVESLRERDAAKAEAVLAADHELDDLEVDVEHRAISLLALQQPMARDLRFVVAAIKISSDLERVGDHAVNIAQCTLRLLGVPVMLAPSLEIDEMAKRARAMLGDAIDAFIRADGTLGRAVCKRDDEVDALEEATFRVLLTRMMENASTISPALQLLLVSRNLERVADLATNVAEDAVYLAEGKQIKHHLEDRAARDS